jgi:hypothetical protein
MGLQEIHGVGEDKVCFSEGQRGSIGFMVVAIRGESCVCV